jgi:TRAP-type C4-dicarboxylate transport system substrate-binding protein
MSMAMMGKLRVRFCRSLIMIHTKLVMLAVSAAVVLSIALAQTHKAQAQAKLTITAVTQPFPTQPQYIRVDQPLLRDGLKSKSNGTIDVKLSAWPEMSLTGPEVLRLVRAGQVDIGASPLSTVSGDVPFLDGVDLAGLHPQIEMARQSANALVPQANKELERFGSRIVAVYPFPAQVIFCRQPVTNLADLKGRKIRTFGASLNDFVAAIGGQAVSIGFPEVYSALERGVADCAVTGTGSGNAAKWYEVTHYIYNLPVGWAVAGYFVNVRWWGTLDQPTQKLIADTMKEVRGRTVEARRGGDAGRARLQRGQSRELQDPHAGERTSHGGGRGDRRGQGHAQEGRRERDPARLGETLRAALWRHL